MARITAVFRLLLLLTGFAAAQDTPQSPLTDPVSERPGVSVGLFSELERLARLVDISYCVGNSGIGEPFSCLSRCNEFPDLSLVSVWNTGFLLSDSCGYIAVDHGKPLEDSEWRYSNGDAGSLDEDHKIVVAFRGTYSITNTVVDLSTVPQEYVPYPAPDNGGRSPPTEPQHKCTNCTVHTGFMSSWRSARDVVLPQLVALREKYPNAPVHLVGHSLGGAIACLAALELKVALGWDNVVVTTFGEPRAGNDGFTRFVDQVFRLDEDSQPERRLYRRITHSNDPVPLLPLTEWGYRAHGGEIFISKDNLSPSETDVYFCVGSNDPNCIAGDDPTTRDALFNVHDEHDQTVENEDTIVKKSTSWTTANIPSRYKLWQLFFAHRDYFWRLGLCVPGGDPANWGRLRLETPSIGDDEL